MSKQKKWVYWIACVLVLGIAAAVIIWSLPKKEVISASKFDGNVQLSALSEDDCIQFIKSRKVSIPREISGADVEEFAKDRIVQFETNPYAAAVYEDMAAQKFVEDIRQAVNDYYKVPTIKNGTYEFDKCLYMTPISSYYPFDGTDEKYTVSPNYFLITELKNLTATQKFFLEFWAVQPVDLTTWDAKFNFTDPVDISGYTYRACYSVNERYQIYLMDNEIWLATYNPNTGLFWSIYQLKLSE